ncbi:DUF7716 domain-containing protein [Luteolibacter soli]|uniref:DUF7716 domain-containing protein n=1 Tax=Luteolibacter soli TaxID=3135280 RepID=A0ABU9AUY3_9BACT
MTLFQIITAVRAGEGSESQWLLIVGDAKNLSGETECELAKMDFDEDLDEEVYPPGFKERGLYSTVDYQTLQDCIQWADRLAGCPDEAAACEVIRYYIRFDAWPDRLGAPDPPPWEETQARLDREFYDSLGQERPGTQCRREGCSGGAVVFSAFCRVHQFENVKKRPCPFAD